MHLLSGLITEKFPTQVVGVGFYPLEKGMPPKVFALLSVQINEKKHTCEVAPPAAMYDNGKLNRELYAQWSELVSITSPTARTVSLIAVPSKDVIGAAHFAISQIDLQVEDGDERFFVEVTQ